MLKCILGEQHGLTMTVKDSPVYLCPSKTTKILISAQNATEYDMHLFLSFSPCGGVSLSNTEPDFFVPAQGTSLLTLDLHISDSQKMYIGKSLLEFKVSDRVLEWQQQYELEFFTENVFKCCDRVNDFAPDEDVLFSRKGLIYLSKGENACIQCALAENENYILQGDGTSDAEFFVNSSLCSGGILSLKQGLNKICISCKKDGCFMFAEVTNEKTTCLNTINPKFFL